MFQSARELEPRLAAAQQGSSSRQRCRRAPSRLCAMHDQQCMSSPWRLSLPPAACRCQPRPPVAGVRAERQQEEWSEKGPQKQGALPSAAPLPAAAAAHPSSHLPKILPEAAPRPPAPPTQGLPGQGPAHVHCRGVVIGGDHGDGLPARVLVTQRAQRDALGRGRRGPAVHRVLRLDAVPPRPARLQASCCCCCRGGRPAACSACRCYGASAACGAFRGVRVSGACPHPPAPRCTFTAAARPPTCACAQTCRQHRGGERPLGLPPVEGHPAGAWGLPPVAEQGFELYWSCALCQLLPDPPRINGHAATERTMEGRLRNGATAQHT